MEHAQYNAPRGQKTARAVGGRPAPLPEVAAWQGRLEQHVMEDLGSICPYVQILDLPVLQMVEQPEEVDSFFRNFVPAVAEQVIEVPKLALPVCAVQRAALSRSWWNSWWKSQLCCLLPFSSSGLPCRSLVFRFRVMEEVLVEVFKASPRDRAQQRFVEQNTSFLQFLTVVEEVLVEVFTASPKDRAQQRFVEQKTSFLQFLTVVEEVLVEVFMASPRDRAQQRFVEEKTSFLQFLTVVEEVLVEVFMASPKDRA